MLPSVLSIVTATTLLAHPSAPLAPPRVVTVKAIDFAFEAPERIPAGTITFRLINDGYELHHLWLVKLTNGKTPRDFMNAMEGWSNSAAMPTWAIDVGGPNEAARGIPAEATMTLEPATYMMICYVPSPDGKLHVMKGMVRPLVVTAAGGTRPAEPKADVVMTLTDYGFDTKPVLTAGKHTIRVENAAQQSHEVVIARLERGTMDQALEWYNAGGVGPGPVTALGGAAGIAKGRRLFLDVDFAPGDYLFLCFIPDAKDGKPHSEHGMVRQVTVK
jgi:hypothetical protein